MAKALKVRKVAPAKPCAEAAVRILRTRLKEFYSHWPDPAQRPTPEQLHNLRISGKRLRYSAESLSSLYPDRLTFLINLLKSLQDLLGEMQDCRTQRATLEAMLRRRLQSRLSQAEVTLIKKLCRDYEQRQEKLFEELATFWHSIARKKFRASLKDMVSRPIKPVRPG
jgi:CHAD domain-containing protein